MATHEDYYACLGSPDRRVYITRTDAPDAEGLSNSVTLLDGSTALVGGEVDRVREILADPDISSISVGPRIYPLTPQRTDLRDWLAAMALVVYRGHEEADGKGVWLLSDSIYQAFGAPNPDIPGDSDDADGDEGPFHFEEMPLPPAIHH